MGIAVHVLLYLKGLILCLQVHADRHIERFVSIGQCVIVCVFHIPSCVFAPLRQIYVLANEVGIEVFHLEILAF